MKKIAFAILMMSVSSAWAVCINTSAQVTPILLNVTTTGIGANCYKLNMGTSKRYVQVVETGTGAISGTILLEGSTDGVNFNTLDTFVELGTTSVFEAIQNDNTATYIRGNITAISGTGATVSLNVGN